MCNYHFYLYMFHICYRKVSVKDLNYAIINRISIKVCYFS